MKNYSEPELEIMAFEIEDVTNFGDNEISAGQLFPITISDW